MGQILDLSEAKRPGLLDFSFGTDGPPLSRLPGFHGPKQWDTFIRDGRDNPLEEIEIVHVQDIEGVLQAAYEARKVAVDTNGFSKEREFRLVGRIPLSTITAEPERYQDPKELKRYLIDHPEFRCINNNRFELRAA